MKDFVDGLSSIDGKAQALAVNEITFNDYQRLFSELSHYQKVSGKDILRVAKKYLGKNRRVTTILAPRVQQQGKKQ